jgi:Mn-dependent DtxR family transcriptional regulator
MLRIMHYRSPNTSLSSVEVSSLRRVASGLAKFLSSAARERLISMGLISLTLGGRLVLTEQGKRRLAEETARLPARAQTPNPFERLPGD